MRVCARSSSSLLWCAGLQELHSTATLAFEVVGVVVVGSSQLDPKIRKGATQPKTKSETNATNSQPNSIANSQPNSTQPNPTNWVGQRRGRARREGGGPSTQSETRRWYWLPVTERRRNLALRRSLGAPPGCTARAHLKYRRQQKNGDLQSQRSGVPWQKSTNCAAGPERAMLSYSPRCAAHQDHPQSCCKKNAVAGAWSSADAYVVTDATLRAVMYY